MDRTGVDGPELDQRVEYSEIERLRRSLEESRQRGVRLLADFESLRRRTAREQDVARHEGKADALRVLLPVLDAFERALEMGSTDQNFYDGMAATHHLFVDAMREAGADALPSLGHAFDPSIHEAVATVDVPGVEPGTVTRELRRGWRLGNELLRPAQVVVSARPEADDSWR